VVGTAARARRLSGTAAVRARRSGGGRRGRGDDRAGAGEEAAVGRDAARSRQLSGQRVALSHCIGAARGNHTAAALCRAGPARGAASDRWGPLSAISE
jgi:hypothetical protein